MSQAQIDVIRANLLGLPPEITDTVIQTIIDSSQTIHDAAIALAESAASLAVAEGSEDIKIGSLAIKSSGTSADRWLAIKDNLIKRKLTGAGTIVDPDVTPDQNAYSATPMMTGDDIPRSFTTDQFNNPPGYKNDDLTY